MFINISSAFNDPIDKCQIKVLEFCVLSFPISRSFQLLDEDEEVAEELAISKWNTDSVEEFLDTVMVKNEEAEIDISENLI